MPDEPESLTELVAEVAAGPKSTNIDGVQVEQHDLGVLDQVAQRQAANRNIRKPHRGLFFNKLVPPGAGGQ